MILAGSRQQVVGWRASRQQRLDLRALGAAQLPSMVAAIRSEGLAAVGRRLVRHHHRAGQIDQASPQAECHKAVTVMSKAAIAVGERCSTRYPVSMVTVLRMLSFVVFVSCCVSSPAPAQAPPNIVYVLADELGYYELSCLGHPNIRHALHTVSGWFGSLCSDACLPDDRQALRPHLGA